MSASAASPAPASASQPASSPQPSIARSYVAPGVIFAVTAVWLVVVTRGQPVALAPLALVRPMIALVALTVLVWVLMLVARNSAVIRGRASIRYFVDLRNDRPDERIERPARTFDNLMQAPQLFYVVCLLMLLTRWADQTQLTLAWSFVALRVLHSAVYIAVNAVPYRFALWIASFTMLCALWYRFAVHAPLV